jgi:hypothetical protein
MCACGRMLTCDGVCWRMLQAVERYYNDVKFTIQQKQLQSDLEAHGWSAPARSLSFSHSLTHSLARARALSLFLSLTHSSLARARARALSLSLSLSHFSLSRTRSLAGWLSLYVIHMYMYI